MEAKKAGPYMSTVYGGDVIATRVCKQYVTYRLIFMFEGRSIEYTSSTPGGLAGQIRNKKDLQEKSGRKTHITFNFLSAARGSEERLLVGWEKEVFLETYNQTERLTV